LHFREQVLELALAAVLLQGQGRVRELALLVHGQEQRTQAQRLPVQPRGSGTGIDEET